MKIKVDIRTKAEEGMFCRNNLGEIGKFVGYIDGIPFIEVKGLKQFMGIFWIDYKSSFNLIDLIEVGDLIKIVWCFESHREEIFVINSIEDLEDVKFLVNDTQIDIKKVLTKEQYEANCYKVVK